MEKRLPLGDGNGHHKGLIDIVPLAEGCSLFVANPQKPPPEGEMAAALAEVLVKWMSQEPVRVLHTLPLTRAGNTVELFVWWERRAPSGEG